MILLKTAFTRLLAAVLAPILICALFYGCKKEPEPPTEPETEFEFPTTEDPWTTEETTEEPTTEEETTTTTTRRATTTTKRTTTTTKATTTTTKASTTTTAGPTTIPDGSGKETTTVGPTTTAGPTSTAAVKVTNVKFNVSGITMSVGETSNLSGSYTISPANATNTKVSFTSSSPGVATVTNTGAVSAKLAGTTTITVKTDDGGFTDTVRVTVEPVLVTGITIVGGASVSVGGSLSLSANVTPSNATNKNVDWSVNDTNIATITGGGILTGKSPGTVIVYAKARDGSNVQDARSIIITP